MTVRCLVDLRAPMSTALPDDLGPQSVQTELSDPVYPNATCTHALFTIGAEPCNILTCITKHCRMDSPAEIPVMPRRALRPPRRNVKISYDLEHIPPFHQMPPTDIHVPDVISGIPTRFLISLADGWRIIV